MLFEAGQAPPGEGIAEAPKVCPQCETINLHEAAQCDCGYVFASNPETDRALAATRRRSRRNAGLIAAVILLLYGLFRTLVSGGGIEGLALWAVTTVIFAVKSFYDISERPGK